MRKFTIIWACICAIAFAIGVYRVNNRPMEIEVCDSINPGDSIKTELIRETSDYLAEHFPKSKITADSLVNICMLYDFDICFAIAQGEIESHMGTKGVAKKTNSPWNVGAYDGRSAQTMKRKGLGYNHPDESIEPYIMLVTEKYLGTNKTIQDLMNEYVALTGHRYASNPNYEKQLRAKYNKIVNTTNIKSLQDNFNEVRSNI